MAAAAVPGAGRFFDIEVELVEAVSAIILFWGLWAWARPGPVLFCLEASGGEPPILMVLLRSL